MIRHCFFPPTPSIMEEMRPVSKICAGCRTGLSELGTADISEVQSDVAAIDEPDRKDITCRLRHWPHPTSTRPLRRTTSFWLISGFVVWTLSRLRAHLRSGIRQAHRCGVRQSRYRGRGAPRCSSSDHLYPDRNGLPQRNAGLLPSRCASDEGTRYSCRADQGPRAHPHAN